MSDPCLDPSPQIDLALTGGTALRATPILSLDPGNGFENRADGIWTPGAPTIVTALPTGASDGDEISVRIPTGSSGFGFWRFVYDASETTTFKWLFTGGTPLFARRNQTGTIAPGGGNDWQTLAGTDAAGPSVALPFAGYYNAEFGTEINSNADGNAAEVGVSVTGLDPGANDIAVNANTRTATVVGVHDPMSGFYGAGDVLRLMYRCAGSGGVASFARRWLKVAPVKVG